MTEPPQWQGRVVVVDDHLLFAHVVVIALTNHGFGATSVDLSDGDERSTLVSRLQGDPPDVLLLDLDLGSYGDGSCLIEPAVRAGVEVVVMTGDDEPDSDVRALDAGARCTIPKTSPLNDLISTLEGLLPGDPLVPAPA
jgi:DNA-binding NarL/FixJ family response regulator